MKTISHDKMREELDHWRTRLDELRVKANLAGKELRDRRHKTLDSFDHAYLAARDHLREVKHGGEHTWQDLHHRIEKGWEELREFRDRLNDEITGK